MAVTNVAVPPKKTASCIYENNLKVNAYIWMMYANNKYINTFYELYDRNPLTDEIISNIGDNIDEKSLHIFL